MTRWTAKALKEKGVVLPPRKKSAIKATEAPEIGEMKWVLKALGLAYECEFKFVPGRDFRADLFIPSLNLLVEYEGLFAEGKNGTGMSRHTTPKGYTNDCIKYFLANVHGYKVLRVTAINYKELSNYIKILQNESV